MESLPVSSGMTLEQLLGYQVVDRKNRRIGTLRCLWSDAETNEIKFLGVHTGWLFRRTHLLPAENAVLDDAANRVRLPYTDLSVKEGPSIPMDAEISEAEAEYSRRYYGTDDTPDAGASGAMLAAPLTASPVGAATERNDTRASRWRRIARSCGTGPDITPVANTADEASPGESAQVAAAGPVATDSSSVPGTMGSTSAEQPRADRISSQASEDGLDQLTVGAQVGAVGASLAGAVIGGTVAGPIGVPVGAVVGAVIGGLAGREIAEIILPVDEQTYWRTNLHKARYYIEGNDFADYEPAFKTGYDGYWQSIASRRGFDEMEADLQRTFNQIKGASRLSWQDAKAAVRDAWERARVEATINKLEHRH
ncbi:MAG: PRC-barrel domain-containing protein [Rhodospirillales bacterium]|nr:PRC-barrel domain-containing protein [Acetobacter sp.]